MTDRGTDVSLPLQIIAYSVLASMLAQEPPMRVNARQESTNVRHVMLVAV